MQNRPTAEELLVAVREFLQGTVMPELTGRVAFHARVAVNVLAIVERELAQGPAAAATEQRELAALLGHDGDLLTLNRELSAAIRRGDFDGRETPLIDLLKRSVGAKLAIDNPRYAGD